MRIGGPERVPSGSSKLPGTFAEVASSHRASGTGAAFASARRNHRWTKACAILAAATLVAAGCSASNSSDSANGSPDDAQPTDRQAGAAAPRVDQVIFIGDSITGGFGYESDNHPMLDNYASLGVACSQNPPPGDACTNDRPGAATGSRGTNVPAWVAYPYQFASMVQSGGTNPPVSNYAVSGATPAIFDPTASPPPPAMNNDMKTINPGPGGCGNPNEKPEPMDSLDANNPKYVTCDPNLYPGLFANNNYPSLRSWTLAQIPNNTLTVMTLGANPILSRMMYLNLAGQGPRGASNNCAQELTPTFLKCVQQDLKVFRQQEHLQNVLTYLVTKGPVIMQQVYHACPGTFGRSTGPIAGVKPSTNADCQGKLQQANAYTAIDMMNKMMRDAVDTVKKANPSANIVAICPGNVQQADGNCGGPGTFDDHQQVQTQDKWGPSNYPLSNPWILSTDTGIHPNATGHRFLAQGVVNGACQKFQLFCNVANNSNTTNWWPIPKDKCQATYYCAFGAVKNNSGKSWTISAMSQDKAHPLESDAGEWILLPPNNVKPGETLRFMIQSRHTGVASGAKGHVTYKIDGTNSKVQIDTLVGVFSNDWGLKADGYKATIESNISQKGGSDMILNGTVSP
jgi:hypothetical protein